MFSNIGAFAMQSSPCNLLSSAMSVVFVYRHMQLVLISHLLKGAPTGGSTLATLYS